MKSEHFSKLLLIVCWAGALDVVSGTVIAVEGIRVPDGFEIQLFADENLANDIYSLTIDAHGRVAVAGAGYVRLLIDHDQDGKADEVRQFSDSPKSGAQGMYFAGDDLLCTGDGALLRFHDVDGDGRADGQPERLLAIKTGGEHDTHALRQGPDGWWYVIAGNGAGVDSRFASLPSSPIRQPEAGVLYRLTPDFQGSEIIADGFRNAYDFDFNALGDLFVFDSDGERDVSLPWYQPTRVFQTLPGSNAGWVSRSWKLPDHFFDMPPVVGRFGRGSPTGVECYRHTQFPQAYRGALFIADWTFGRVIALPLDAAGSTYRSDPIEFMSGVGTFGFAPTDMAVGPDGSLFVSVGGRGTRGSVYRVRYVGESKSVVEQERRDPLTVCLAAPQPLSSWSRAAWEPIADAIGREFIAEAALDASRWDDERIRAIEILVERFGGLWPDEFLVLRGAESVAVRARAAWSMRYSRNDAGQRRSEILTKLLNDDHPFVARVALESVLGGSTLLETPTAPQLLLAHLDADDRYVRQRAACVAARLPDDLLAQLVDAGRRRSPRASPLKLAVDA